VASTRPPSGALVDVPNEILVERVGSTPIPEGSSA
jgi:hypothetical protein